MSKSGSPLPSLDQVDRVARASLPFRTTGCDASWSAEDGLAGLWVWHNEQSDAAKPLNLHPDGAEGWSGYFVGSPDRREPSATGGVWAHFHVTAQGAVATSCASGTEQVFYAESAQHVVVGTRAQLVALAAFGEQLVLDTAGLAAIVNAGFSTTDRTIFDGVRVLRPGWRIVATQGAGVVLEPAVSADFDGSAGQALIASVSGLPATASTIRLGLTGGRDSRLLAGLLVKAGVPVRAYTAGDEADPDVVIARRVAEVLGIEHSVTGPRGSNARGDNLEVDPRARVREAVALGEGMLGAYDRVGRIDESFKPALIPFSGSGGEILRGYYANALHGAELPDVARRVLRRRALAQEKLLTADAKQQYLADLQDWMDAVVRAPGLALSDFYLRQRTARWSGAARGSSSMGSLAWRPFFDHHVVQAVQAVPLAERTSERFFASLIDELVPELADVPFVGKRWAFEELPPSDPGERARWVQRAPLKGAHGEGPSFNWRTDLAEVRAELGSIVESAPDAFWAVVDHQAVDRYLQRVPTADRTQTVPLWNLATVAHAVASSVELGEEKFSPAPTAIHVRRSSGEAPTAPRITLSAYSRAAAKRVYLRLASARAAFSRRR
ncbi:asparagine synthase-related protein [Nocardioides marmorisolisilvae]|uniref:asparagine synthase-related protein n=1 Tax=Nocardioides marmorisolisilvae TaxID=1542737 RepID=UPI00161A39C0|nr:asparagine synthase-related protein [Nocardioides marmorisolisilvae]